ncbi:MAG: HEPN domain-containing protein [Bacteroidota bacterium]
MNENNKYINEWIEKADHDLGSAKIIYSNIPEYFDVIAFHCQQAVEKYLKSTLIFFEKEFSRSHDLVYLLELLSREINIDNETFEKAIRLNSYSTQIRYPNSKIFLTKQELEFAIEVAEYFRVFAIKTIGISDNTD